jgi:hypothetical protein
MASAGAQAQQPKPSRASLSYEEISKLFSLPIAEAASILGTYALLPFHHSMRGIHPCLPHPIRLQELAPVP